MVRLSLLLMCGIALATLEIRAALAGPEDQLPTEQSRFSLAGGTVRIFTKPGPDGESPRHLLLHFHGAPEALAEAFARSRQDAVVMVVNFPGLSSAYSRPFQQDPRLFAEMLQRASGTVRPLGERAAWEKITLSCFSAGYGAVREILRSPDAFEQIDAIVAADSIYASLDETAPSRRAEPDQMHHFLTFAALAAEGSKTFVITHSAQPTPYASTTETADYLLSELELPRSVDTAIKLAALQQRTRAARGRFVVLGFDGTSGKDHMQHLHHIDLFWDCLGVRAPAASGGGCASGD